MLGTTTVLANGSYAVVLNTAQTNGEPLTVIQADGAGNASPSAAVTAPDLTAPLAPAGIVSADGTTLTGTGEAVVGQPALQIAIHDRECGARLFQLRQIE